MYYLITNENDTTWRDVVWGPEVSHEVNEPNYFFEVYEHIPTALFMQHAYEDIQNPKVWECSIENPVKRGVATLASKVTTHKCITPLEITDDQRITFAMLCSLQVVLNPIFRDWAFGYLNGSDTDKNKAIQVQEQLMLQIGDENIPEAHDYISCAHACLATVFAEDIRHYAAYAAHRAYYDSPEQDRIDIPKLSEIAVTVPREQIAEILAF